MIPMITFLQSAPNVLLAVYWFLAPAPFAAIGVDTMVARSGAPTALFNGTTLEGWEGNKAVWRVENGAIVGGDRQTKLLQNEFLSTTGTYSNFDLELKFKIIGYSGFVNAGVQFHSQRLAQPPNEMIGFQADIGDGCMGSLYDESRRNRYLVEADQKRIEIKKGWNHYRIRCENNQITLWINGIETVRYAEPDNTIPRSGHIGLQVHGGGVLEVFYKDLLLTRL